MTKELVIDNLTSDDDPALWEQVLKVVIAEFNSRLEEVPAKTLKFIEIGACSHWLRPHQTRWKADGGFAWPSGYDGGTYSSRGLPEFDWSIVFQLQDDFWQKVNRYSGKQKIVFRIAVPSRTTRHNQAAIHCFWPHDKETVFLGFRKEEGEWCLRARQQINSPA
jgi:hypothetical protein